MQVTLLKILVEILKKVDLEHMPLLQAAKTCFENLETKEMYSTHRYLIYPYLTRIKEPAREHP